MQTITEMLQKYAQSLQDQIDELLSNHARLERMPRDSFVFIEGDHKWRELTNEGRQLQSKLMNQYAEFHTILNVLLKDQHRDTRSEFDKATSKIQEIIEQRMTWRNSIQEVLDDATEALGIQIDLLSRLYDGKSGTMIYVPDTNALLHNPALDAWRFTDAPRFTLMLLPTILAELDELKINHRNEVVREKAERLIRQLKEYRRRGQLLDGVTLAKDVSIIQTQAIEPKMDQTLPWLDKNNNDDRFLAGVLEVMRNHPRSIIQLVTRDINMQNKAEFARLPYVEPPVPQ